MKPACRIIGRERQRLEDLAPNNPISEECWNRGSLPPPVAFEPIRWSNQDTDEMIRQVNEHNAEWAAICRP